MLNKEWVTNIEMYSKEWNQFRLGKFTSSKAHSLMTDKPLTKESRTYINQKVGEFITGQPGCSEEEQNIENEYTAHGVSTEPESLRVFSAKMNVQFLVTGKLIHQPGTRFSSTPDALWIINSSVTKENHYNVATVEAKCPFKFPVFISLFRCKTPADLKEYSKPYYWQVLDQMDTCGASVGYFLVYHPMFPVGKNLRIIEFKQVELWNDFAFMKQRKAQALEIFSKVYAEICA